MPETLPAEAVEYIEELQTQLRRHQRIAADLLVCVAFEASGTEHRRLAMRAAIEAGYNVAEAWCDCGTRIPMGTLDGDGQTRCHGCGAAVRVVLGKVVMCGAPKLGRSDA